MPDQLKLGAPKAKQALVHAGGSEIIGRTCGRKMSPSIAGLLSMDRDLVVAMERIVRTTSRQPHPLICATIISTVVCTNLVLGEACLPAHTKLWTCGNE